MIDNESKIKLLKPEIQQPMRDLLSDIDKQIPQKGGLFCSVRSYEWQDQIYEQGRTILYDRWGNRVPIVTNARGGQSYHQFGIAADFVWRDQNGNWTWAGPYDQMIKIVRNHGFETGADFPNVDKPHIQKSYGQDVRKLDYIYQHAMATGAPMHKVFEYLDTLKGV